MAEPIMTMLHESQPEGRLVRLGWDTSYGSASGYYVMPDDGRDYLDIPKIEMRPYPAFDAMSRLGTLSGGWSARDMWNAAQQRQRRCGYDDPN